MLIYVIQNIFRILEESSKSVVQVEHDYSNENDLSRSIGCSLWWQMHVELRGPCGPACETSRIRASHSHPTKKERKHICFRLIVFIISFVFLSIMKLSHHLHVDVAGNIPSWLACSN